MSAEEERKKEYAVSNFNTCDHAGVNLRVEVNRLEGTQALLGFCDHERRWVDVEPTCRICLRHTNKKYKTSKKTAATIERIKKGRLRQKQRKEERENPKIKRPGLEFFR